LKTEAVHAAYQNNRQYLKKMLSRQGSTIITYLEPIPAPSSCAHNFILQTSLLQSSSDGITITSSVENMPLHNSRKMKPWQCNKSDVEKIKDEGAMS